MVCNDLPGFCLPRQNTHSTKMTEISHIAQFLLVSRGDLQLVDFEPLWGPSVLHTPKLTLTEAKVSVCEQKNSHTDVTRNQIQNHLNKSPVYDPETIRSLPKYIL
jgi:hypothetical protein